MSKPSCVLPGCERPSRNTKTAALCPMHYHRQYRHGSVEAQANHSGVTASHGRRYRRAYRPGHPIATKYGSGYEHRFVLYDTIGAGPHRCHWCAIPVEWTTTLEVDHVNHIGDDNRAENLVPSCRSCNQQRASERRSAALRDAGWWSEHDTIARLRDPSRRRKSDAA